jgi:putative transposase
MKAIDEACQQGLSLTKACEILQISERRVYRWRNLAAINQYTRKKPDRPREHKPYNALTPDERQLVDKYIADKEFTDASCRDLSILVLEREDVYISHVTFWEAMKSKGINGPRGVYSRRRENGKEPDYSWATEPNQLWAWDITWLRTYERHKYFYLYTVLDCVSRKVVGWAVSDRQPSDEAQYVWDKALVNENLIDKPADQLPRSLCDRGSQMGSISTRQFFKALGIEQLYSRPRTPNDNPHIEALFSTVKNHPDYPGRFATLEEAKQYFERFFDWYNNHHYRTSLGMIPPAKYHAGQASQILVEREAAKKRTLARRRSFYCRSGSEK